MFLHCMKDRINELDLYFFPYKTEVQVVIYITKLSLNIKCPSQTSDFNEMPPLYSNPMVDNIVDLLDYLPPCIAGK